MARHRQELEWQEASLPAERKRVLLTWWYGQAWEKFCERFDFEGVFDKCGSSLTADGSEYGRIKPQKMDSFSFDLNDAKRLAVPTTGEFPETLAIEDAIMVRATEKDDEDCEEIVEDHGEAEEPEAEDEEDGGETSDGDLELRRRFRVSCRG